MHLPLTGLALREEIAVSEHHHSHDHDHTEPPSDLILRVQALESLLIEKGLVGSEDIHRRKAT